VAQSAISRHRQFGNPGVFPRGPVPATTRDLTLIPQRGVNGTAWCTLCQAEVHVVRLHLAHHFVSGGQDPHEMEPVACLHHMQEDDGSLLICLDSLVRQYQQGT